MATTVYKINSTFDEKYQMGSGGAPLGTMNIDLWVDTVEAPKRHLWYNFVAAGIASGSAVPPGATTASASIAIYGRDQYGWHPQCHIYGIDADDAAAFTTEQGPVERTRTPASVEWDQDYPNSNAYQDTPDLAAIVQEIVDRTGYAPDAIAFSLIAETDTFGTGLRA